jgi:LTXXQ motif family protein
VRQWGIILPDLIPGFCSLPNRNELEYRRPSSGHKRKIVTASRRKPVLKKGEFRMKPNTKLVQISATIALATVLSSSAFGQMGGGGMTGGFGSGSGMMGGFGGIGGNGAGTMGGYAAGSRNGNGYGPGANDLRRDAPVAPEANRTETFRDHDLGPLDQLNLSRQQLGAIEVINEDLRDRRSNLSRRLAADEARLRGLYNAPQLDRTKIDRQFRRIDRIRREMFESTADARDRIEAQLSASQRQRLHRIAPHWNAGG